MSFWKFLIRLVIGVAMVGYLLCEHEVAVRDVLRRVLEMPFWYFAAALALYLAGQLLSAYRWASLSGLGGHPVNYARVWPVYFSGMFFNTCLPTSIGGDVVRVVGLSRQTGSKSAALASVFMDRNVGLAGLLVIGFVSSCVVTSTIQATLFDRLCQFPLWPFFVVLISGYIAVNMVLFSERFYAFVSGCIGTVRLTFLRGKLEKFHSSLTAFRQPWRRYAGMFVVSLVYQATEIFAVWLLAKGLRVDVPIWVIGSLVTFQAVACLLPVTFNGVGVREGIFCGVLMGQLGSGTGIKNEALALSLIYFGVILMSSMIGGGVYLVTGMPRPSSSEIPESVVGSAGSIL